MTPNKRAWRIVAYLHPRDNSPENVLEHMDSNEAGASPSVGTVRLIYLTVLLRTSH